MKSTRGFVLASFATVLAASRLIFVSPAVAAPVPLSVSKVEKIPGPDFQSTSYFTNQRAAYQQDKAAHPEKYTKVANKEPEWFFTGKPYDADSKSYLFLYRNYRPDSASWMQPDPAGFPDGPNNYAYAPVPTYGIDRLGLAVNINLFDPNGSYPDSGFYTWASLYNDSSYFTVAGHGWDPPDQGMMRPPGGGIPCNDPTNPDTISAYDLSQYISMSSSDKRTIELLVCHAGTPDSNGYSFAQDLADFTHHSVLASPGNVHPLSSFGGEWAWAKHWDLFTPAE